jgi:hypothetical protein
MHETAHQILLFGRDRSNLETPPERTVPNKVPDSPPMRLARASDPVSSQLAAEEVTASGHRDSQKREILAALRSEPEPVSSMELSRATGLDRYVVARRLPDLERDGMVERGPLRTCRISNRAAVTWSAR